MSIVIWVLIGGVIGLIGSIIGGHNNTFANIITGVVGAGLAGFIATRFGIGSIAAFGLVNALIALGGAVVLVLALALIMGRSAA